MERTYEEELCGMLKEGRCVAGRELENARQVIRELREENTDMGKAFEEEMRASGQCEKDRVKGDEEIARQDELIKAMEERARVEDAHGVPDEGACRAAREEAETLRADVAGLELELEAVRTAKKADDDLLTEEREVFMKFIAECAELLELPKMDGCSEYCGGAIRKGIEELAKKLLAAELTADGVVEGAAQWEDDCKTAQKQVKELDHTLGIAVDHAQKAEQENLRLRGALEKINEIRNDIVGRANVNWSAHIYPIVAALNEAGFEGMDFEKAREKIEVTMTAARMLVAVAWCSEKTEQTEMDVVLAEEFAEILLPFLEALEFYALLGNWQGSKADAHESACDRDLGSRARSVLGRPDRDVPEIIEDDDGAVSGTGWSPNGSGS